MRSKLIWPAVIFLMVVVTTAALGSQTNWNCSFRLYAGSIGGSPSDITGIDLGVCPGATDAYDPSLETPHAPCPGPPMACLYWYRTTWGASTIYTDDWRSALSANTCKTWCDLRATCDPAYTLWLYWIIGYPAPGASPPAHYTFTLFDEGAAPDCSGGTPVDMKANESYSFANQAGALRYFHVEVCDANTPLPTCSLTATPNPADCGQTVTVSPVGTGTPPLFYYWDLDGDGQYDDAQGGGVVVVTYMTGGNHLVGAKITDVYGQSSTCSVIIQCDITPPTITTCASSRELSADANCQAMVPDLTSEIVATDSCASYPLTKIQNPPAGTVIGPGASVVTIAVCDSVGNCSNCTATLTVLDHEAPSCTISASPAAPVCNQAVSFTASASDNCGVTSYHWDFGDGDSASDASVTHQFLVSSTVILTVSDAGGNSASCTADVILTDQAPVCTVTASPNPVAQNKPVTLDASSSSDPDAACGDSIVSYEWDLDNDGVFDDATGPTSTTIFSSPGTYPVCVKVTDTKGLQSSCCMSITVTAAQSFDVKVAQLSTATSVSLCNSYIGKYVQIKVQNTSTKIDALVRVELYRWRNKTSGALDLMNTWDNVTVLKGTTLELTPKFYYTYEGADAPGIQWKAVVVLLNGTDSNPSNNVRFLTIKVSSLPAVNVSLVALSTRSTVHLNRTGEYLNQYVQVKVKNFSSCRAALVSVTLYKIAADGTTTVANTWNNVTIPIGTTLELTPKFYYTYVSADIPKVTWRAEVTLLNFPDANPTDNVKQAAVIVAAQ